jgi:hypothetical protein
MRLILLPYVDERNFTFVKQGRNARRRVNGVAEKDRSETESFFFRCWREVREINGAKTIWRGRIGRLPKSAQTNFDILRDGVPFNSLAELFRIIRRMLGAEISPDSTERDNESSDSLIRRCPRRPIHGGVKVDMSSKPAVPTQTEHDSLEGMPIARFPKSILAGRIPRVYATPQKRRCWRA